MHINTRLIKVTDFKSEVKFDHRGHQGHLMASDMDVRSNMHINIWVVEEIKFISEIQLDLYRTICPSLMALVAAGL